MDILETYLQVQAGLDEAAIRSVFDRASRRTLQRNELLLQEGQVCRHKTFVVSGLLRHYGLQTDGSEHILQFAPEAHWVLDAESYDCQLPARYNIAAVVRSELLCWTKTDFDCLLEEQPRLRAFSQQLISRNIHQSRQRLFNALSASPEEKYAGFVAAYPELLQRLPLHMIASYLGISLKTLTRIRHSQWRPTDK